VTPREELISLVRQVILNRWPDRFDSDELRDDVSLGGEGLGLDSVEVAEVLLECEDQAGATAGEDLFGVVPLTIERVAEHLAGA
jgi:acyl carrier protein